MKKKEKIFVLDTSVLLHDFDAIVNFKEHLVAIPITVLEELDKFKIGNDTKNFSAREVIRFIDKLSGSGSLQEWITLGKGLGKFKVVMDEQPTGLNAEKVYALGKNDHKIINAAVRLIEHRYFSNKRHQFAHQSQGTRGDCGGLRNGKSKFSRNSLSREIRH